MAGSTITVQITSGASPYASSGSYNFLPAAVGSTYNVVGISGVADSSGTYSYIRIPTTSGYISYNDSIGGTGFTDTLSFDSSTTGTLFLKKSGGSGYQTGTFTIVAPTAPTISSQPQSQTVIVGSSVTFSVAAAGTAPLTYQWRKNGANISGATSASYALANALASHAGSYTVVVTNPFGSVTSSAANLTVNNPPAPVISSAATAVGTVSQAFSYQIVANNSPTSFNATGLPAGLSLNTASGSISGTPSAAGTNTVTLSASNAGGTGTKTLTLMVSAAPPSITTQPQGQTVTAGANVTFSVTATGTGSLAYQWRKDGIPISGATNTTLNLPSVATAASGSYQVLVRNSAGFVVSQSAVLNVRPVATGDTLPRIVDQSRQVRTVEGRTVSLFVSAVGSGTLTYAWTKDVTNALTTFTGPILTLTSALATDSGVYRVTVSNGTGSATSETIGLNVHSGFVMPPPAGDVPKIRGEGFRTSVELVPNRAYAVQFKNSLSETVWQTLTNFTATGPALEFLDQAATNQVRRFYRVVSP